MLAKVPVNATSNINFIYELGTKLPHKKLETLGYHMVKTRSLYLTWH